MKNIIWPTIAVLGLALVGAGCKSNSSLAHLPENSGNGPRRVRTVPIVADTTKDVIQASGTTASMSTTKVQPVIPGLIRSLPVKEGDVVKQGQILALLDQRNYQLTLRQAEAAIASAKVAVDATTREKGRFQKLMQEDATARAQFDQRIAGGDGSGPRRARHGEEGAR
jgi:multidrug efflux system membrane fusion protein